MEPIEVERATSWAGRVAGAALAASAEQGRLLARSGLQILSPFGRELLAYVAAERERVGRGAPATP